MLLIGKDYHSRSYNADHFLFFLISMVIYRVQIFHSADFSSLHAFFTTSKEIKKIKQTLKMELFRFFVYVYWQLMIFDKEKLRTQTSKSRDRKDKLKITFTIRFLLHRLAADFISLFVTYCVTGLEITIVCPL